MPKKDGDSTYNDDDCTSQTTVNFLPSKRKQEKSQRVGLTGNTDWGSMKGSPPRRNLISSFKEIDRNKSQGILGKDLRMEIQITHGGNLEQSSVRLKAVNDSG